MNGAESILLIAGLIVLLGLLYWAKSGMDERIARKNLSKIVPIMKQDVNNPKIQATVVPQDHPQHQCPPPNFFLDTVPEEEKIIVAF